ncbi:MAG: pilus assembly protein PilM [Oceanospirillaceae bacterium]|nr:pilus assembly protein PilM [Oceanospirillaceae bacterium]
MSDTAVAISYGVLEYGEFMVRRLESAQVSGSEQVTFIKNWVTKHKLKNADCHFVLNKQEYNLELIESPHVEDAELVEAVRWRLKDLIQTPIEETAIDVFPLPNDAYRGRMRMVYVVAVAKSIIEQKLTLIRSCGLDPKVIDIEELALRNIALYLPEVNKSTVALLGVKENNGEIYMFSNEDMYLTRSIDLGMSSLRGEIQTASESQHLGEMADRFVLDIQRSLDYYESQLGKGVANSIYLLPFDAQGVDIKKILLPNLIPPIHTLDCRKFIPFSERVSPTIEEQEKVLTVIGAVLRRAA